MPVPAPSDRDQARGIESRKGKTPGARREDHAMPFVPRAIETESWASLVLLIHVPGDAVRSPREGEAPSEPRGKARTEPRPPKEPDSISGFLYEGQDRGNAVIVGALAYVGPGVTVPIRLTPAPSSIARRSEPTRRSAR